MPPLPTWFRGRDDIATFLNSQFDEGQVLSSLWRFDAAGASGQAAMIGYRRNPETGRDEHSTLTVLTFDGERIAAVVAFMGQDVPRSAEISAPTD
jgi:RNA polymerase sigma-70 factor (ECF subfamily)